MTKKRIIIAVCLLPIIIWLGALLKCDILTIIHYKDFNTIYRQNTMMGDIDYFKVLDCSETSARVYYVSKNRSAGDVLLFLKKGDIWTYSEWEQTVWSSTGSASDVIWPYWWHFIYGGF